MIVINLFHYSIFKYVKHFIFYIQNAVHQHLKVSGNHLLNHNKTNEMENQALEEPEDNPTIFNIENCAEKKQSAVWDDNAVLALLSIYEANMDLLDHPKKKAKLWDIIATDLEQKFGIEMTKDQVR
ncbi:uncharacterized protein [Prorops nasuta]|uniref:uncharacterized protein isoform X2 n=1 Tax=Prorops nasuta TaxID=863751 RepID=UPI0034CF3C3E